MSFPTSGQCIVRIKILTSIYTAEATSAMVLPSHNGTQRTSASLSTRNQPQGIIRFLLPTFTPHLEVSQSNEISQAARAISGPQLPEGKWRPVLWSPSILGGAISSSSGRLTADVAARRFRGINLSVWSFKPACAAHQALSSSVPQEASLLERGSKLWTIKSL